MGLVKIGQILSSSFCNEHSNQSHRGLGSRRCLFSHWLGLVRHLGRHLAESSCKTATDIERTHNVGAYVLAFVASIVVNYALAWLIMKLNAQRAVCGLGVALICWFAFVFIEYATISVFSAFETNPWPLICIDMGRPLIGFAISGLVLGAWRKS